MARSERFRELVYATAAGERREVSGVQITW